MHRRQRNPIFLVPLIVAGMIVLLALGLSACGVENAAPPPESDSGQYFTRGSEIPVDDNVYTITGQVVSEVGSLTRQTEAARGSISGSGTGGFAYISGSYYGPEFGGKGFIRLHVLESDSFLAPWGEIVILKSTDTKGVALLPGDVVTFKCRHQYEAIAAVRNSETFDQEKLETWEIDYCRFVSPVISQLKLPTETP